MKFSQCLAPRILLSAWPREVPNERSKELTRSESRKRVRVATAKQRFDRAVETAVAPFAQMHTQARRFINGIKSHPGQPDAQRLSRSVNKPFSAQPQNFHEPSPQQNDRARKHFRFDVVEQNDGAAVDIAAESVAGEA